MYLPAYLQNMRTLKKTGSMSHLNEAEWFAEEIKTSGGEGY